MQKVAIRRYEKYKDSGVEWLGEIPEGWVLTRLGTKFEERKTKVSDKDFLPLSVTKNGTVPQLSNAAKTNDGDNRKLVKKGDFVINSRSDRKGSSGIAFRDGSVSLINIVIKPNGINPTYCNYLLKSYNFVEEFYRMGHGIVADLWTTRYDEMRSILIGIPTLIEQTAIAQFLDDKCGKINLAIANKERLIELLKERKQILIQNAVTGKVSNYDLNDTCENYDSKEKNHSQSQNLNNQNPRPMKDSGVEWIGEIPEEWEVKRIKHLGRIVNGYAFKSTEFSDEGVRVMKISNIQPMKLDWTDESFINSKYYESLKQFRISKNDLVFALTRPIISTGIKATIVDIDEKILLNQRNAVLKPSKGLYKKWIYYVILDNSFIQTFDREIDKTGQQPNISTVSIGNIKIPVPPYFEQVVVSKYIETQSAKIDKAISLQQQQIEKLKEYKASLINSAVTGKIKVV